jgi:hypothetical protein
MKSFNKLLIERIQAYFKKKYGLDIPDEMANEYLDSLRVCYPNLFLRIFTSRKSSILKTSESFLKNKSPKLPARALLLLLLSNTSEIFFCKATEPPMSICSLTSLKNARYWKNYFRTQVSKVEMWLVICSKVLIPYWQM